MIDLQTERQRKAFARVVDSLRAIDATQHVLIEQAIEAIEDLARVVASPPAVEGAVPQFVSFDEAAKIVNVDRSTVFGWVGSGQLGCIEFPSPKGDRPIRKIALSELLAFAERHARLSVAS
jgi:hypothetical protein